MLDNMLKLVNNIWSLFSEAQVVWKELNAELGKTISWLSDVERREIPAAVGLGQGHWYTCHNGHVYAIGDCGGAIVESICPGLAECPMCETAVRTIYYSGESEDQAQSR